MRNNFGSYLGNTRSHLFALFDDQGPSPFEGRGASVRILFSGVPYFLTLPSSFMITSYSAVFFFTRAREASGPMNSVLKPF